MVPLVELGRLPDRHVAEVRAARVRIPDARNDRRPARFEQLPCVAHRRVQTYLAADFDQPPLGQPDRHVVPGIAVVLVRDDRVDAVVVAVELQDDQDAAVFLGAGGVRRRARKPGSVGASAIKVEFRRLRLTKSRRVIMVSSPEKMGQIRCASAEANSRTRACRAGPGRVEWDLRAIGTEEQSREERRVSPLAMAVGQRDRVERRTQADRLDTYQGGGEVRPPDG